MGMNGVLVSDMFLTFDAASLYAEMQSKRLWSCHHTCAGVGT